MRSGGLRTGRHRRGFAVVLSLLTAVSASGCASVPKFKPDRIGLPSLIEDSARTGAGSSPAPYRIGPLDEITVVVWGRPDLGSQVAEERNRERRLSVVAQDGRVPLPLLEWVPVAGLSLAEAAAEIAKRYEPFVTNPHVEVQLSTPTSQTIYVFGEVLHQGTYPIPEKGLNVLEALSAAGGPNPVTAKNQTLFLLRPNSTGPAPSTIYELTLTEVLAGSSVGLLPGDRLYVPPTGAAAFDRYWRFIFLPLGILASIATLIW